jgi:hypothetical protein
MLFLDTSKYVVEQIQNILLNIFFFDLSLKQTPRSDEDLSKRQPSSIVRFEVA